MVSPSDVKVVLSGSIVQYCSSRFFLFSSIELQREASNISSNVSGGTISASTDPFLKALLVVEDRSVFKRLR